VLCTLEALLSNRKPWETASIELYIAHLNRTLGSLYVIEKEHVPVGGGKNCDFVLRDEAGKGPRVAAELVQIIDDPKAMEGDFFRVGLWNELRPELEALGVKGVVVGTPWDTPPCWMPRKLKKENTARLLAARIKAKLDENPTADTVEVDGLKVKRVPGLGIVGFGSHSGAHWGALKRSSTRTIRPKCRTAIGSSSPSRHRRPSMPRS
jgi:hypothetical protein